MAPYRQPPILPPSIARQVWMRNIDKWPSGGARRRDAPKAATMTRRTATPVRAIETRLSTRGRESPCLNQRTSPEKCGSAGHVKRRSIALEQRGVARASRYRRKYLDRPLPAAPPPGPPLIARARHSATTTATAAVVVAAESFRSCSTHPKCALRSPATRR